MIENEKNSGKTFNQMLLWSYGTRSILDLLEVAGIDSKAIICFGLDYEFGFG